MIRRIDQILARLVGETQVALILQAGATFEQNDYPELLSHLVTSQKGGGNGAPPPKQMVSVKTIHVPGVSGVLDFRSRRRQLPRRPTHCTRRDP